MCPFHSLYFLSHLLNNQVTTFVISSINNMYDYHKKKRYEKLECGSSCVTTDCYKEEHRPSGGARGGLKAKCHHHSGERDGNG